MHRPATKTDLDASVHDAFRMPFVFLAAIIVTGFVVVAAVIVAMPH